MWTIIAKPALKKKPKKLKTSPKRRLKTSPKSKSLVKKTKNRPNNTKIKKILKTNPSWPPTETSLEVYEELLDRGYDKVTFVAWRGACGICKKLNGKTWDLDLFLAETEYDAPLFSHTHVGSKSQMKVWDSTGEMPEIYVDYQGNMS